MIGTEDHIRSFDALFDFIYKGNEEAKKLSFDVLHVLHTWDDVADKDPVEEKDINKAFLLTFFEFQNNNIWVSCGLNHHLLNVFLRWRDANVIEQDLDASDDDLAKSYMLRAGLYDLFVIISYYLHGDEWAAKIGPYVRKFYGETYLGYVEEMRSCQIQ